MLYVYRSAYLDAYSSAYSRKLRYWRHYRMLRRTLEYAITAAAAVLASYLILQVRW